MGDVVDFILPPKDAIMSDDEWAKSLPDKFEMTRAQFVEVIKNNTTMVIKHAIAGMKAEIKEANDRAENAEHRYDELFRSIIKIGEIRKQQEAEENKRRNIYIPREERV